MKHLRRTLLLSAILLMGLTACHDDTDMPSVNNKVWTAVWVSADGDDDSEMLLSRWAGYETLHVSISGRTAADSLVLVSCDADWLSVASDTLAADSLVSITTTDNDTGQRRTATLTFTGIADLTGSGGTTNLPRAILIVTQLSDSDFDSNGDPRSTLFVGYGYDIYKKLDNPMSVKSKESILDVGALFDTERVTDVPLVHDARLSKMKMDYMSATDINAYGEDLAEQQCPGDENRIRGCTKDCEQVASLLPDGMHISMYNMGHATMTKLVASRTLDRGGLNYLKQRGWLPYSKGFANSLVSIINEKAPDRLRQKVQSMLRTYGTHMVIQADLGGRIDYAFCMDKTGTVNLRRNVEQEALNTLGQGDGSSQNLPVVATDKSQYGSITVIGGSAAARTKLQEGIRGLGNKGHLSAEDVNAWMSSINYSGEMTTDESLDVVHFELMPVWDLVPDQLRAIFLDETLLMVRSSDCQLPASVLEADIYEIEPQGALYRQLFDFSRQVAPNTGSLCRLLYFESEPVIEVCSEYVPQIRSDERVIIAYPIHDRQIHINQGLFLGDGIHQPAYVGFSNGVCYVNPIDTMSQNDIIKKFWYVGGNLLLRNPTGLPNLKGKQRTIQEDYLPIYTDDDAGAIKHRHPIVKLGSKFWTRRDIDHRMQFAEQESYAGVDQIVDNVCYTQFMWEHNTTHFANDNKWVWGNDYNIFFKGNPNMKWYLPSPDDIRDLHQFIGYNTKALFKDQVSGWDAQFNGYYGHVDILNRNRQFSGGKRDLHYKGELNAISSKNANGYSDACLLVLRPDYSLTLVSNATFNSQWRNNFYPVRPVRGFLFKYPTTKDINDNFTKKAGKYQ